MVVTKKARENEKGRKQVNMGVNIARLETLTKSTLQIFSEDIHFVPFCVFWLGVLN